MLRLLKPGLRLLLVDLRLVYSNVERLRAVLRLQMSGMNLLMTPACVMLIVMLRVRRLLLKRLLTTWFMFTGGCIEAPALNTAVLPALALFC